MPEISIIIPCYNYAHYLRTSVDSVLNQSYSDFELILIDDGSTDDTWKILQEYAGQDSKVRIFQNLQNKGIFESNQIGWQASKGKYLHFFSADDFYHPGFLNTVMHFFHSHPYLGLVCTDIRYFKEDAKESMINKLLPQCTQSRLFLKNEMIPLFQSSNFWLPGLTCVVKQETLKKYGHLDPKLENISDWFYFHRIALHEGVGYIPEALISMRLHEGTYTSRVKRNKKRRRATYSHLLKYLKKNKCDRELFKQSGLLTFIFNELYWKLRLHPYYLSYWRYLKKISKVAD